MRLKKTSTRLVVAFGCAFVIAACSAALAASTIVIGDARSRPATGTGVVYATITNVGSEPDRLLAITSPVASSVEMHESIESSTPMGSMNGMPMAGGMMSMKEVRSIVVPAHGRVTLATGGYHLMLVGLHHDLKTGEVVPLTFRFARAGRITVAAHVGAM